MLLKSILVIWLNYDYSYNNSEYWIDNYFIIAIVIIVVFIVVILVVIYYYLYFNCI